jgi:hypothetical protein
LAADAVEENAAIILQKEWRIGIPQKVIEDGLMQKSTIYAYELKVLVTGTAKRIFCN